MVEKFWRVVWSIWIAVYDFLERLDKSDKD